MNPEEGDLRPQLLDRFGLAAEIRGDTHPATREEIVRRRIAYDADPAAFLAEWTGASADLQQQIIGARELLPSVVVSD